MIIRDETIVERTAPDRGVLLTLHDSGAVTITTEDSHSIAIVEMTADEVKRLADVAATFAQKPVSA